MKRVRGNWRPNVSYRGERLENLQRGSLIESQTQVYQFFTHDELQQLARPVEKMLARNTASIMRCVKCKEYFVVPRKTKSKLMQLYVKKYGGYCCKQCHMGLKPNRHTETLKRRKIYRAVMERMNEERNKALGIKTYNLNDL